MGKFWKAPKFCLVPRGFFDREYPSPLSLKRALDAFNDATRAVASSGGVFLLDADKVIGKTEGNFIDDVHYTKKGAEELAGAVVRKLADSGLIVRVKQ